MWRKSFTVTARGLRRSLWADDPGDLEKVSYLAVSKMLWGAKIEVA